MTMYDFVIINIITRSFTTYLEKTYICFEFTEKKTLTINNNDFKYCFKKHTFLYFITAYK